MPRRGIPRARRVPLSYPSRSPARQSAHMVLACRVLLRASSRARRKTPAAETAPKRGTARRAAKGERTSSTNGTGSPTRSCRPPSGQSPPLDARSGRPGRQRELVSRLCTSRAPVTGAIPCLFCVARCRDSRSGHRGSPGRRCIAICGRARRAPSKPSSGRRPTTNSSASIPRPPIVRQLRRGRSRVWSGGARRHERFARPVASGWRAAGSA